MNVVAPSGDLNVAKNSDTDIFGGEAGIVKALSTLRQAAIPPESKNSLRDLFLAYAGESDEAKRSTIKNKIVEQIGKNPQLSSLIISNSGGRANTEARPQSNFNDSFGQTRPAPDFSISNELPAKVIAPEESATTAHTPKIETTIEEVVPKVVPEPPISEKTPKPPTQIPSAPAEIEPVEIPTPAPAAPVAVSTIDVRARIDAIKHDINGRVGNPVNVINADETIGREYMSALLDAMKRSSAGGGAESLPRLEAAYKATLDLIIEKGLSQTTTTPPEPKVEETKTTEIPVTPPTLEAVAPVEKPTSTLKITRIPTTPVPTPVPAPTPVKDTETPPPTPPQQTEGLYHHPSDETEVEATFKPTSFASKFFKSPLPKKQDKEVKPAVSEIPNTNIRKVEVNPKTASTTTTPPTPIQSDKLQPLQSASVTLPEKMAAIKSAAAKREEEAKKPITDLKSPEVEAGLRQLLSEWVLFKKSGFLGTGPSGIDHPLYKKLASMPMASVISGRFEGVTPDIKRHLSDYMTGWRYEQGVMHEMGETFENYLRRVIRQVLERQRAQANTSSN